MALVNVVLFSILCSTAIAEVANFWPCSDSSVDVCEVSEVRIVPCADSFECRLISGKNASISFDFTPKFVAQKLKTSVHLIDVDRDMHLYGFAKDDACLYTNCPTEAGKEQTSTYTVHINKLWPKNHSFTLKWKVWNEENDQELCCFRADIRFVKK